MGLRCTSKPAWKPPADRHQPLGSEEPRGLTPARTRPPRRRVTTSDRRPKSEDLDLELPTRSGAPRSTFDRTTRDRSTPPEEPLPPDDPAPHPEGYHTAPPWAPTDSSRDPSSDPSTPKRSEDHFGASSDPTIRRRPRSLASLHPSPRTPSQHQPRHADPKDGEAREANALRPCGPISSSVGRPATPKDHPSEPSARLSALGAHHRRPPASLDLSEELSRATDARLRAPRERARSDRVSPSSSEEPSGGVRHRHRAPRAQPAHPDRAARPRRDELRARAAAWPLRSPSPNVRATSGLRRARRRGAERSERPRSSPSSTPGRSSEPEGSNARQGCRAQALGASPKLPLTLDVTPKNHTSSPRRQHPRTG